MKTTISYEEWKIKRKKLLYNNTIISRRAYRRGDLAKGVHICSLCGKQLTDINYSDRKIRTYVNHHYLDMPSFLHVCLCIDSKECYNNFIKKGEENGS